MIGKHKEEKKTAVVVSFSNIDNRLDGYKIKSPLPFKIFLTLAPVLYFAESD